jgi:hypothetical protein
MPNTTCSHLFVECRLKNDDDSGTLMWYVDALWGNHWEAGVGTERILSGEDWSTLRVYVWRQNYEIHQTLFEKVGRGEEEMGV